MEFDKLFVDMDLDSKPATTLVGMDFLVGLRAWEKCEREIVSIVAKRVGTEVNAGSLALLDFVIKAKFERRRKRPEAIDSTVTFSDQGLFLESPRPSVFAPPVSQFLRQEVHGFRLVRFFGIPC